MTKQEKIALAINMGFITVRMHPAGLLCYSLTQKGRVQWELEKMQKKKEKPAV